MLSFNMSPIFDARGIDKPYSFLVKAGIAPHTATRILNNYPREIRLDHVELICRLLLCEPNDLLLWTPDKGVVYPENHPLYKLARKEEFSSLKTTFSTMPLDQLKEVTKIIAGSTGGELPKTH